MVRIIRLPVFCVAVAVLAISGQQISARAADEKPIGVPTEAGSEAIDSPEGVVRAFLLAVLSQDAEKAQAHSLEDPDFQLLFEGPKRPEEAVATQKALVAQLPIRQLKVGEELTLRSKKKINVNDKMVNEDRAMVMSELFPEPVPMQKVDGIWKVDPRPILAYRKASGVKKRK